jgi:hypothetical protein
VISPNQTEKAPSNNMSRVGEGMTYEPGQGGGDVIIPDKTEKALFNNQPRVGERNKYKPEQGGLR